MSINFQAKALGIMGKNMDRFGRLCKGNWNIQLTK